MMMKVRTFQDLVEWVRLLHEQLAARLRDSAAEQDEALARALLNYLAEHEARIEKMIKGFEQEADDKALKTYVYDYLSDRPMEKHRESQGDYSGLGLDDICSDVFEFHQQVMGLYQALLGKAEIPEIHSLLESLMEMEKHEAMLLAKQTGRLHDL